MKKTLLAISLFVLAAGSAMFITSCSKDDTPPVITIVGDNPATVSLNGTYVDLGATATDDKDGNITTSITSVDDVNEDKTGSYTVTYSVSDKEGNNQTATRTVNVVNDAEGWAGSYTVNDDCSTGSYQQTVTASTTVNNRILFNKFADYSNNTAIYATISGSTITLPFQIALDIGSLQEDHNFTGVGTKTGDDFVLGYTDNNTTQGASANCQATFTKN